MRMAICRSPSILSTAVASVSPQRTRTSHQRRCCLLALREAAASRAARIDPLRRETRGHAIGGCVCKCEGSGGRSVGLHPATSASQTQAGTSAFTAGPPREARLAGGRQHHGHADVLVVMPSRGARPPPIRTITLVARRRPSGRRLWRCGRPDRTPRAKAARSGPIRSGPRRDSP
jgi:hypothetical protein